MTRSCAIAVLMVGVVCIPMPAALARVPATAVEPQTGATQEDCTKDESATGILSRNPDRECSLPTGITIGDKVGRGISIAIRIVSAQSEYAAGLVFGVTGADDQRTGYVFSVHQDGSYQLVRRTGQKVDWLIDRSRSQTIKTGPGSQNELMVLTTEGMIRLFVNGRYVGGHRFAASESGAGGISYYAAGVVHARYAGITLAERPSLPAGVLTPGKVVVSDDLVSRKTFQVGGERVCRALYDEDGYVVVNVAPRGLCDLPLVALGSFGHQIRFDVDVKLRTGPMDQSFGIFFGWSVFNPNPMFAGLIDGQGTFQITRRQGQWQRLTRLLRHDPIRTGVGAWNRLGIEIRDQSIRGYVNGQLVGEAVAGDAVEGAIGFYVNQPGMAVVFRNLVITEL